MSWLTLTVEFDLRYIIKRSPRPPNCLTIDLNLQLTRLLGLPELAQDPDFASNASRVQNRDRLLKLLSDE